VLYCDDGLGGEIFYQLDLLVGEGVHFLAIDADCSNQIVFFDHRHHQKRSGTCDLADRFVRGLGCNIGDVDKVLFVNKAIKNGRRATSYNVTALVSVRQGLRGVIHRDPTEVIAFVQ